MADIAYLIILLYINQPLIFNLFNLPEMDEQDILKIRLHNQLLTGSALKEAHKIVSYMGAMQSQAFEMAKWGIGIRLKGSTNNDIEESINAGKIIRTHILRPTWHFIDAEDLHWMSELSIPKIRPAFVGYAKYHGIEESLFIRTNRIIEKLLADGNHMTRLEISEFLIKEKIIPNNDFASTIMSRAEIDRIVCSGKLKNGKSTYALIHEWVPKTNSSLSREEALERLGRKFFTSHGPATLQDFIWWSGMTLTDARKIIELIKHDFICEEINGRLFWMKNDIQIPPKDTESTLILPPFDEFVVSYKDRSELIEDKHYNKVMTKNGLFSPTVMLNGKIIGSWKKTTNKGNINVELSFFEKTTKKTASLFNEIINEFCKYCN